ncbi:hypothetical protein FM119_08095 [Mycetocola reblochoni REB411]|uniref:Uncharacterized protein n=1 Tax=Mycetocola reblochoni REB411 TaxID=1255698 RepID=A0A1R4JKW2_9MICO|nr:hypothetical protein FM119_08095 [Mycetocola reblochoni REB411]
MPPHRAVAVTAIAAPGPSAVTVGRRRNGPVLHTGVGATGSARVG